MSKSALAPDKPAARKRINATPNAPPMTQEWSLQELAGALVKVHGAHEGHFELGLTFLMGLRLIELDGKKGPGPVAIIEKVGIRRVDAPSAMSVDAAVVNPAPSAAAEPAAKKSPPRKRPRAG